MTAGARAMTRIASMRSTPGQPQRYDVTVLNLSTTTRPAIEVVLAAREYEIAGPVSDALNYLFGDRGAIAEMGRKALERGGEVEKLAREIAAEYGERGEAVDAKG